MLIDSQSLDPEQMYRLLSGVVVPRPIAWIATASATGVVNLAPFSCFTFVSNKPPLLGVNIGRKAGVRKDTAANLLATRECVVHVGNRGQLAQIHESADEFPPEVSEVDALGLATAPSTAVRVPRLADAPIAMECRLDQVVPFGATGAEFFVVEVVCFHFRDGLLQNGRVDTRALDPVCRIGGPNYAALGEIVTLRTLPQTAKSVIASGDS